SLLLLFFLQDDVVIRDRNVTGVQTCAPPMSAAVRWRTGRRRCAAGACHLPPGHRLGRAGWSCRSHSRLLRPVVLLCRGELVDRQIGRASCRDREKDEERGGCVNIVLSDEYMD